MKFIILFCIIIFVLRNNAKAQGQGIEFIEGLEWKQIKEMAKEQNKYIFLDCYATWCGPCKYMDKNIFSLPDVGNFFKANFISIRVQMDTNTASDNGHKLASFIATDFLINSYPTYLFFSSDGKIVHRVEGAVDSSREFISKAQDAMNPEKQYYTLKEQYIYHRYDSLFLHNTLVQTQWVQDLPNVEILDAYTESLRAPMTSNNIKFIADYIRAANGKTFSLFYNNFPRIIEVLGRNTAEGLMRNVIFQDEIAPIFNDEALSPNWTELLSKLENKYPQFGRRIIAQSKIMYFKMKGEWSDYGKAVKAYMAAYGDILGTYETNDNAWGIFLHVNNKRLLMDALKWSKRTIVRYPNVGDWEYVDTYANLLYKVGNVGQAIFWEKNAIAIAKDDSQKKEFESTLHKMQEGAKTWE